MDCFVGPGVEVPVKWGVWRVGDLRTYELTCRVCVGLEVKSEYQVTCWTVAQKAGLKEKYIKATISIGGCAKGIGLQSRFNQLLAVSGVRATFFTFTLGTATAAVHSSVKTFRTETLEELKAVRKDNDKLKAYQNSLSQLVPHDLNSIKSTLSAKGEPKTRLFWMSKHVPPSLCRA